MPALKTKSEILSALKETIEASKDARERIEIEREKNAPVVESEETTTGVDFTS